MLNNKVVWKTRGRPCSWDIQHGGHGKGTHWWQNIIRIVIEAGTGWEQHGKEPAGSAARDLHAPLIDFLWKQEQHRETSRFSFPNFVVTTSIAISDPILKFSVFSSSCGPGGMELTFHSSIHTNIYPSRINRLSPVARGAIISLRVPGRGSKGHPRQI